MRGARLAFLAALALGFASGAQAADKHHGKAAAKPAPAAAIPDTGADAFLNLYVGLCVKRFGDFEAFRTRLLKEKLPKLAPQDAAFFLNGMKGDAWPVPYRGRQGNFVLALPAEKNLCTVYARRTDALGARKGFVEMTAKAPAPMVATQEPVRETQTRANGKAKTVSSVWAPPGARRKVQFMLTTSESPKAALQGMASVAIISTSGSPAPAPRPRARP